MTSVEPRRPSGRHLQEPDPADDDAAQREHEHRSRLTRARPRDEQPEEHHSSRDEDAAEEQPAGKDVSSRGISALRRQHGTWSACPELLRADAERQRPGLEVAVVGDDCPADAVVAVAEAFQGQNELASAARDAR